MFKRENKSVLASVMDEWLERAKISCKQSTITNYEYVINSRLKPMFGYYKKKSLKSRDIDSFTLNLQKEGLENKTIRDILILLQQILKYANIPIVVLLPKLKKKDVQILDKKDLVLFANAFSEGLDGKSFGIYLSLYTGMRIGEVCALQWKDIDLDVNMIFIRKTLVRVKNDEFDIKKKTKVILDEPKSLSSIRSIPIPSFLVANLKRLKGNEYDYLLTGSESFIEPRSYENYYKKYLKSIGIEKNYHFHILRHTFATSCIEKGCDVKALSEILGHASVKITLERYVHPRMESKIQLMNVLEPIVEEKGC